MKHLLGVFQPVVDD